MSDRNFDDLAERFEEKIHDGFKGTLRRKIIWRDLLEQVSAIKTEQNLRILDIGGGIGHFSIELAKLGHNVTYNDLSVNMMGKARQRAFKEGVADQINWSNTPYQQIATQTSGKFDLILCHAVIEWLQEPEVLIPSLKKHLQPTGALSLCYYNPAGFIYRNLICGNFKYLDSIYGGKTTDNTELLPSDSGSLTPQNPCSRETIEEWLTLANFTIKSLSGIRVFSDYVLQKRGGNLSKEDTLKTEMLYSSIEPYKYLGRYLHTVAACKQ